MTMVSRISCLLSVVILSGCVSSPKSTPMATPLPAQPPGLERGPAVSPPPVLTGVLTLPQVLAAVTQDQPEGQYWDWERQARQGALAQAGRRPNPSVGLSLENFAGSGELQGTGAMERTVMLSQEWPGKERQAAQRRVASLAVAQVKNEVADWTWQRRGTARQQFAAVQLAQRQVAQAKQQEALAQQLHEGVQVRIKNGDLAPSELSPASVELSLAALARQRAELDLQDQKRQLAALWGASEVSFEQVADELAAPVLPASELLQARLAQHPAWQRWEHEEAARAAQLRLVAAEARPAVEVGVGLRQFGESDEHAWLVELSLPLPGPDRQEGALAEARARLAQVASERQAAQQGLLRELHHLTQAWPGREQSLREVREQLLPAAQRGYDAARQSFAAGNLSLYEALAAERALLDARQALSEAEADLLRQATALAALLDCNFTELSASQP